MKARNVLFPLLVTGSIVLTGCKSNTPEEPTPTHEHVDENHDHICDECNERFSEHTFNLNPHECDICGFITNHIDNNIDGTCDICENSWSKQSKELFISTLGEVLPFFEVTTAFEEKVSYVEATISGNATDLLVSLFEGTTKYTHENGKYLEKDAVYLRKISNKDNSYYVEVMVLYNETTSVTFVDAYLTKVKQESFPSDKVLSELNGFTTETPIFPTDGSTFIFEDGETDGYCLVTYDGAASTYLTQLVEAGYYLDYSMVDYYLYPAIRAMSPGRSLAIQVTDKTSEVTIEFMGAEVPNETEWSDLIKSFQMTLFEEILPFPNANFIIYNEEASRKTVEDENYFQVESDNIDAFKYALDAMRSDTSFAEEYEEDGGFYTFSKSAGYFVKKVVISCLWGKTTISFLKVFPIYETWPEDEINYCLGDTYVDIIPESQGTGFYLHYQPNYPNIANVTVYGTSSDFNNYVDSLKSNGYSIKDTKDGWLVATGKEKSIQIHLFDATEVTEENEVGYYKVEIHIFLTEKTLSYFPMDAFINAMDPELDFTGFPVPTGETFTPSYPYGKQTGAEDIMFEITGGDMAAYVSTIQELGYVHTPSWDYDNYKAYLNYSTHIAIYVYDFGSNTDYSIEYQTLYNF